jgi:protein-disulfide isomerase
MKLDLRPFAAALFAILVAVPAAAPARAQSFTGDQRGEIERIVREYLLSHPELLQEVMSELEKRQAVAEAEKHRTAVKQYSEVIFSSPRQVTLGNTQGDVTVVEFFDYNCGYCKRAMSDMLDLMKNDAKLKFVLKEFPVLGEGSMQAAQVAAAVRMQDKSGGKKYLEFHQKLLTGRGRPTRRARSRSPRRSGSTWRGSRRIWRATRKAQLEEASSSRRPRPQRHPELRRGQRRRGRRVGLNTLKEKVNAARCGKATC